MLSLIILSSAVLYEMIGPACAKLSLKLSGSIESDDPSVNAKLVDRAKQYKIPVGKNRYKSGQFQ